MGEFIIGIFNTSVVTGLSIAAAGILLKISGKRYSARCRRKIWIFMAFCFLIPFHLFHFPGAYTAEIPNIVLREFDTQAADGAGAAGLTDGGVQSTQNHPVNDLTPQISVQGNFGTELTVADVLFIVWACAGVLLAVYYTAGYWRMRGRIRRWSSECENGHVQEIIAEAAAECKLKRIPKVRIMRNSAEGPFTTGVLRNIIILPDDVMHEKDLQFILKHEAIHCRNHDISWRLFFLTVNIIHWFNPLVWYLRRAMEQDMEIACDEEVVTMASREKRKEYSDVIMSLVERSQYKGSAVSTGYVNGVKFLKRRFDNIFNEGAKRNGILLAGSVCIFALFIGCVIQLQNGGRVYHIQNKSTASKSADEAPASYKVSWQGEVFDSDRAPAEFYDSLNTLVWMAYRGGDIIAEDFPADKDAYIAESIQVLEGSDEVKYDVWVRMIQEAVEPESGSFGQVAHKDYIFYRQGEDAYIGIQSVENNGLWTILKMVDYGDWLEKEIEIYIRMTTGL